MGLLLLGDHAGNAAHPAFPYLNAGLVRVLAFRCQCIYFSGSPIDYLLRTCRATAVEKFAQYGINGPFGRYAEIIGDSVYAPDNLISMRRPIRQSAKDEELAETGIQHAIPIAFGGIVDTFHADTSMI